MPQSKFKVLKLNGFRYMLYSVAEGLNRFSCIVRNFNSELFFESHNKFNCVQAICAKVIDERGILYNFIFLNTQVLYNNFLNAVSYIAHISGPYSFRGLRPWFSAQLAVLMCFNIEAVDPRFATGGRCEHEKVQITSLSRL